MHLMRMSLGGIPPFDEPVRLKFDERVNLSYRSERLRTLSTILSVLADR